MDTFKAEIKNIKSEIKLLKFFLIIVTILDSSFIIWLLVDLNTFLDFSLFEFGYIIIATTNLILWLVFIWYVNNQYPSKKNKTKDVQMILFLGIIGMWLWLPNQKDLNNLSS